MERSNGNGMRLGPVLGSFFIAILCVRCCDSNELKDYCSVHRYENLVVSGLRFTKEVVTTEYANVGAFKAIHCCLRGYRSIEWWAEKSFVIVFSYFTNFDISMLFSRYSSNFNHFREHARICRNRNHRRACIHCNTDEEPFFLFTYCSNSRCLLILTRKYIVTKSFCGIFLVISSRIIKWSQSFENKTVRFWNNCFSISHWCKRIANATRETVSRSIFISLRSEFSRFTFIPKLLDDIKVCTSGMKRNFVHFEAFYQFIKHWLAEMVENVFCCLKKKSL